MSPLGTRKVYEEVIDPSRLHKAVEESLQNYNTITDKPMDLVLFSFAVEHLLIITRILKQPTGNACPRKSSIRKSQSRACRKT
jgi:dynein heavy chain